VKEVEEKERKKEKTTRRGDQRVGENNNDGSAMGWMAGCSSCIDASSSLV
jgi:hypothetical protein